MSHLLALLMFFVTILFSSLFSPASGQFSFRGFGGTQDPFEVTPIGGIPSGGIFEISTSRLSFDEITHLCFSETPEECVAEAGSVIPLPPNTQLESTNSDVASVSSERLDEPTVITLHKPGSTILQLRSIPDKEILASFVLVLTKPLPGTQCEPVDAGEAGIVDCSGTCVFQRDVGQRLGDGVCDDGKKLADGSRDIDLSCVFPPEFFLTETIFDDIIDVVRINRDAGDCDPKASCTAQFGDAPDFEFCSGTANLCSFNATTGFNTPPRRGTCAAMCQRFGSRCVAALDNAQPGCTPSPDSRDTCETPRQTEICVCEQRSLGAVP